MTARGASQPAAISTSRTPNEASAGSDTRNRPGQRRTQQSQGSTQPYETRWSRERHANKHRMHSPGLEWHIKWDKNRFLNGRVLIIDYISNEAAHSVNSSGKRHVAVAAQEFQDLQSLQSFYADPRRYDTAALRVIHVQNARWATMFLLTKFNIDHPSEVAGMQGFTEWARYETPRHRNGKPLSSGRSFREQTDPWRNVSRTAFGLDYLKVYPTAPPEKRTRPWSTFGRDRPVDAKMMHLKAYEDVRSSDGFDVSVQRLSTYVQRKLGHPGRVSPDVDVPSPYKKDLHDAPPTGDDEKDKIDLKCLDNSNTVIIFEASPSLLLEDCLIQPRNDFENRWRRLSFYLEKKEALNDALLASQCTNMILGDIFHGLAIVWEEFLHVANDHVSLLEDKIYDNPADESRAPELWTNQAFWLKVDKIMWMHQDLVREVQSHMRGMTEVEEGAPLNQSPDWLASIPAEYEKLGHSVQEDLVQPTANLSDLMYKSVGIRDSRQSLQLGVSMWRLSWITFIFLPLTFIASFFGMNVHLLVVDTPSVGWYFLSAIVLMIFVLGLWYSVKHSLQRGRQTPYQRGAYEHLFSELQDEYPLLWNSSGASDDVEPSGFVKRMKWRLLKHWFAPDETINPKLNAPLALNGDDTDLGVWARFKCHLLMRWLPDIRGASSDPTASVELGADGSRRHSLLNVPESALTINELAKASTPLAVAEAEPTALQQISRIGLSPPSSAARATSPRHSEERPSSWSGMMFEERNWSDSESDVEHAVAGGERETSG